MLVVFWRNGLSITAIMERHKTSTYAKRSIPSWDSRRKNQVKFADALLLSDSNQIKFRRWNQEWKWLLASLVAWTRYLLQWWYFFRYFMSTCYFLGYADGYLKFKFSTIPKIVGDIFRWLIHNPRCPTVHNKKAVIEKEKVPTVIFSHGMSNQ